MVLRIRNELIKQTVSFKKINFVPEFSWYENYLWLKLTGQKMSRYFGKVSEKFFDLQHNQEPFFNII